MRWPFLASFLLAGCASNPALPKAAAPPLVAEEPLASAPTPPPSHQRVVDELASTWIQAGKAKGIAVGLLSRGTTEVYGYGRAADGDGARAPDGNTVFEIGSVTKVFTAVLLAQMAERKLVAIEEPLRELLPGGVALEGQAASQVRLLHLATHTSGLPRLPDNLKPKDESNPYSDYGQGQLYEYLSGHRLDHRPGADFEYSNVGAGLLGHLLARRAGRRYENLVLDWIAHPLGMTSTEIALSDADRARLAAGHDPEGHPVPGWDLGVLEGSGALRSTVNDLVRFLDANLELSNPELAPALTTTQMSRFARPGGRVGLGWMIGLSAPSLRSVRWHNGRTGGYASFVAFDHRSKTGVVVLANSSVSVDRLGGDLLNRLVREPSLALRMHHPGASGSPSASAPPDGNTGATANSSAH